MRYLNRYKIFEDKQDIDSICSKYKIRNYTINSDGTVDVKDDVDLSNTGLSTIPLKFGKVTGVGGFFCANNQITSLKNCPSYVSGHFYCASNQITSLEYSPRHIGGAFYCNHNLITSLEHCPQQIDGNFYCIGNPVNYIIPGFTGSERKNELIELFNDTDIIQDDDVVIYDRLVWFFEEIDMESPDIHEIAKHYKIIR